MIERRLLDYWKVSSSVVSVTAAIVPVTSIGAPDTSADTTQISGSAPSRHVQPSCGHPLTVVHARAVIAIGPGGVTPIQQSVVMGDAPENLQASSTHDDGICVSSTIQPFHVRSSVPPGSIRSAVGSSHA